CPEEIAMATIDTRAAAPNVTTDQNDAALLASVLPGEAASAWWIERPKASGDYRRDIGAFGKSWQQASTLLAALPKKPARNATQAHAAALIQRTDRANRDAFLTAHTETLYGALTKTSPNSCASPISSTPRHAKCPASCRRASRWRAKAHSSSA